MPEVFGRFRNVRLSAAPASPQVGEQYYDTSTNVLYWWNGTAWQSLEVYVGTTAPSPRTSQVLWVDTS